MSVLSHEAQTYYNLWGSRGEEDDVDEEEELVTSECVVNIEDVDKMLTGV